MRASDRKEECPLVVGAGLSACGKKSRTKRPVGIVMSLHPLSATEAIVVIGAKRSSWVTRLDIARGRAAWSTRIPMNTNAMRANRGVSIGGGIAVVRYGTARDLVLGLEVVLPNGEIVSNLKGLRKDNTGYNLNGLFLGAEASLGVITAAVLKLSSRPRSRFFSTYPPIRALSNTGSKGLGR